MGCALYRHLPAVVLFEGLFLFCHGDRTAVCNIFWPFWNVTGPLVEVKLIARLLPSQHVSHAFLPQRSHFLRSLPIGLFQEPKEQYRIYRIFDQIYIEETLRERAAVPAYCLVFCSLYTLPILHAPTYRFNLVEGRKR